MVIIYKANNFRNGYYEYTLVAPLWFGLWNIISLLIADHFNLSKRMRYLVVTLLSNPDKGYNSAILLFNYEYEETDYFIQNKK